MPRYSEDSVFPAGAEKCPTLYGRVMLPKPAFNIRRGGGGRGAGVAEMEDRGVSRKKGGRKSASGRAAEGKPKDLDGAMASLAGKNILRGSVRRAVRPSVGFATPPLTQV